MRLKVSVIVLLLIPALALAQSEEPGIDVIHVSGPLDRGALDFIAASIEEAADSGQVLALVQVDSPAALDGEALGRLLGLIREPPLPLAVWVGPIPAEAYGGAALIAGASQHAAAAPGSRIGLVLPVVPGDPAADRLARSADIDPAWLEEPIPAEESGLLLQPSIRQYLQALDGVSFTTTRGEVIAETLVPFDDGVTLRTVTFREPGLGLRFFRLAASPEAAYFFLLVGLTVAAFEFFAIGPGVAAAVSVISLLLAGWGMVNLPLRPWALGLAVAGWAVLTAAYQRGGAPALTFAGAVLLQLGGMYYVAGSGQIDPRWYLVLPSVLAVLFFYLLAMPTVQRARFSTRTIGRDTLIGETGLALGDFTPDGEVEVGGARWKATAHREAGIRAGAPIRVTGVDGLYLEVEPTRREREN